MKKISMSVLFFGTLSVSASNQPTQVDQELVTAAVAGCSLADKKDGWACITKEADAAPFAGKLVEYQLALHPSSDQQEIAEHKHSYTVPGFVDSFFGYILSEPQTSSRPDCYEMVPLSKVNRRNAHHAFVRDVQTCLIERCSFFRMRQVQSEALPAIKGAISQNQGAFQGTAAFLYKEDIDALLAGTSN